MLISVTSKLFDIAGAILLDVPAPDFGETRRRSSRIATLDGGAVVNDFGFTDSDRTISLQWPVSGDEDESIKSLIRYHDRLRVATPHGLMECIVESYTVVSGEASFRLLPVSRLSE